jgi:hypothetical protein
VQHLREREDFRRLIHQHDAACRVRRATADAERARVNVTRSLRATIDRITQAAPVAGAHLTSSIRTGTMCRYQPGPGGPDGWST